jgi:hypothetical protein
MRLPAPILVVVLAVLTPLAHGSPVDPSLPGFWDAGDGDDVILFLTSDLHFLDWVDRPALRGSEMVSERVFGHPRRIVAQRNFEPSTARAPPTA